MNEDVAIVGAGAAGLMAAATLLEQGFPGTVHLIEKNPGLGRKVLISGGGRCNVTTGREDVRAVLEAYPRGAQFLKPAMGKFPPKAVVHWFEAHGVPLKKEADGRIFPCSDNGEDVVGVFERLFHAQGDQLRLHLRTSVEHIERTDAGFRVELKDGETLTVGALVLATGGQAYRHTGSTGDGYQFAEQLGHTITPLAPSLNSFLTHETWPARLSGLSFPAARLTLKGTTQDYDFTGPFLFTHKGLSGPAVFALSSLSAFETYASTTPLPLFIDLFPYLKITELEAAFLKEFSEHPAKKLRNSLDRWLSPSFIEVLLEENAIPAERRNAEVSKPERTYLIEGCKRLRVTLVGRGTGDEFVTAGGVALNEINAATMASKVCPGLYLGGEILNVDGFTGGYNLQAAWCTGRLAAQSIVLRSRQE